MHYLDYNEKRQHGTNDFPLAYYDIDQHHPRYTMPFHWHQETELLHICKGNMRIYLNDKEFLAHAGDLIYIAGGVIHGGEPENCIYECLVFDPTTLLMHTHAVRQYLRKTEYEQLSIHEHFSCLSSDLSVRLHSLFSAARIRFSGWEMSVLGGLFQFYGILFREGYFKKKTDTPVRIRHLKIQQLKPVLEYIEGNYSQPITLDTLSRIAGMSPKYFCRIFRTVIHRTPIDYLNYYRIEKACYLLETEDLSITEVAYHCGFNDSSYFIRCFKKYKQITPTKYLKKQ